MPLMAWLVVVVGGDRVGRWALAGEHEWKRD